MKLSNRKSSGPTVELQMTSMIDVTFLLLIFFMVTSSITKTERELDPQVKVNKPSSTQKANPLEPAIIDLVSTPAGARYKLGGREFTSAAELTELLKQFENKADGSFVRVPREVTFEIAAAAIQACKTAGFTQVSYVPKDE